MRIIIYIDEDGEIFIYTPDVKGEAMFIQPTIKREDTEDDEPVTH